MADDNKIGLIGSLNEDMTALNMWLVSKDGTVVATLTLDIFDEDKANFASLKLCLAGGCTKSETKVLKEKGEEVKENAPSGSSFGSNIPFKHLF